MHTIRKFEFPANLLPVYHKAKSFEKFSIAYLISIVILEYLVMGNIQTMKTIWLEDILSFAAPISFLITSKIYQRTLSARFPYGFHGIVKIAFLIGSVALMGIGAFLLIDGLYILMTLHKPTIPYITIFYHKIWLGYFIILVMLYKTFVPMYLGIVKIKLAKKLHDKILFVDGHTNRADWLAALGGILGVFGIALGWWWSDALIAIFISLDILIDGFKNTKQAIFDLMDETPTTVDRKAIDPVVEKIKKYLETLPWVEQVKIRMREEGHVYFGEALIVPKSSENLSVNITNALDEIYQFSWRIHDFLICPVEKIPLEKTAS